MQRWVDGAGDSDDLVTMRHFGLFGDALHYVNGGVRDTPSTHNPSVRFLARIIAKVYGHC